MESPELPAAGSEDLQWKARPCCFSRGTPRVCRAADNLVNNGTTGTDEQENWKQQMTRA
jgi:hypothetical protein